MKYRDHSQNIHTDNPEYSDTARYAKLRLRYWYEDQVCDGAVVQSVLRLAIGAPVPSTDPSSMFHAKAWKGLPFDRSEIQWPSPEYPVDEFGRGVSVLEMAQRRATMEKAA